MNVGLPVQPLVLVEAHVDTIRSIRRILDMFNDQILDSMYRAARTRIGWRRNSVALVGGGSGIPGLVLEVVESVGSFLYRKHADVMGDLISSR